MEDDLGLERNVLLKKLTARTHNMSCSIESKHTTLMGFTHQSIVTLFETLTALLATLERDRQERDSPSIHMEQCKVLRSIWSNEKVHSILHVPRTLRRMGRSQNVSCQVTETRHKGVKRKGSRTNRNPGTSGLSIMNAELRDALDEEGACKNQPVYACICNILQPMTTIDVGLSQGPDGTSAAVLSLRPLILIQILPFLLIQILKMN